jgi:hypothetical protein
MMMRSRMFLAGVMFSVMFVVMPRGSGNSRHRDQSENQKRDHRK